MVRWAIVVAIVLLCGNDAMAFGQFGILDESLYRGARWDAAPRQVSGIERSLDGGLRFSLEGGSYESYRDQFEWREGVPTVDEFRDAIHDAFHAWTVTDPTSKLPGMLTFTEDFGTNVEIEPLRGSEIDLFAADVGNGQRGFSSISWDGYTNMSLTSAVTYVGQPIIGADIQMNNRAGSSYSLDWFRLILTHEIGHALGLVDVDLVAGVEGAYIDDNYDGSTSESAQATLTNAFAHLINPLNPGASPLQKYTVANGNPGFDSGGADVLMESNVPSRLLGIVSPLQNDDYAGRQFLYPAPPFPHAAAMTLADEKTIWRAWDQSADPGVNWNAIDFDDNPDTTDWRIAQGHIGYGDGDENTTIDCGPSPLCSSRNNASNFFRASITIDDVHLIDGLIAELVRDDAAAVFINGVEVFRDDNLPSGTPWDEFAIAGGFENGSVAFEIPTSLVISGTNLIAVEVHQDSPSSSDVSFEFNLNAFGTSGDFNGDLQLNGADIDLLSHAVQGETYQLRYDLDRDEDVDDDDRRFWVEAIRETYFGDSNADGEFNTTDLVLVFQANEFEDNDPGNSNWATGDWDGDSDFTTSDLVLAFQSGGFEIGPRTAETVPEPASVGMLFVAIGCVIRWTRRIVPCFVLHVDSSIDKLAVTRCH